MNSSRCFIDPKISENELVMRVLKGYHGLHHYANEFWYQHLLYYAKSEDPVEDEELDEPLEEIRDFWKQDPGKGAEELKLDDTTSAEKIKARLEVLASNPVAHNFGLDILTFQKFLSQENASHQAPESKSYVADHGFPALTPLLVWKVRRFDMIRHISVRSVNATRALFKPS